MSPVDPIGSASIHALRELGRFNGHSGSAPHTRRELGPFGAGEAAGTMGK
jgi:hypothetical protein